MDTPKASVKKIAINYGLILALCSIVVSVLLFVMDKHIDRPWWASVLSIGIMVAVLIYGLKAFKAANGGFMSLGEALKTGLAISLIAGIVGALFNYIFVTMIEPEFVNKVLALTEAKMYEQNPNLSEADAKMALDMTEAFMSPWLMSAFALIGSLFFGFIISLIAGLVMKQPRPTN